MRNTAKILKAGAGSGKTFRLAYEYILEVLGNHTNSNHTTFDPTLYRHILAVTFTNKATEEMKSRILKSIDALAAGRKSDYIDMLKRDTGLEERELRRRAVLVRTAILHDYSRFTILTNDTFFQRILRAFVKELSLERSYAIEIEKSQVLAQSTDALIAEISTDKELRKWFTDMISNRVSRGEKWMIRNSIAAISKDIFEENTRSILDSMGSRDEIKADIDRYTKPIDTKRDKLIEQAKQLYAEIDKRGYKDGFAVAPINYIMDVANGKIKQAPKTAYTAFRKSDKRTPEKELFAERMIAELTSISQAAAELETAFNSRDLLMKNYHSFALMRDLYKRAMLVCRDENKMILSETKYLISDLINCDDAPFIYEKVGTRFDKFMIDEFQDTSLKEWQNFLPLLRNAMAQSERISTLLVGDIKQSIYRWRGGDWRILGDEARQALGDEATEETLDCNYRSLPQIVEFNNMLFGRLANSLNMQLNDMLDSAPGRLLTAERRGELYNTIARAYTAHAQNPKRKCHHRGYIDIMVYKRHDDATEQEHNNIIGTICHLIDMGYNPCDITILVRNNKEGSNIAQQLLNKRETLNKRYHFDIMTQEALNINSSYAVSLVLSIMRLAIDRRDSISRAIYNRYCHACDFGRALSEEENAFLDSIRMLSPEEAFEQIVIRHAAPLQRHMAYVEALHEHIINFCTARVADIASWLKWWEDNGEKRSICIERSTRSLEILTIHKAKGLENKAIIIPNCDWALTPRSNTGYTSNIVWAKPSADSNMPHIPKFPLAYKKDTKESIFSNDIYSEIVYSYTENLNLLYVALTRAKEQLYVFINEDAKGETVGKAVFRALKDDYTCVEENGMRHFRFGVCETPEPSPVERGDDEPRQMHLNTYVPSPVDIELRSTHSRYFEEAGELKPQDMGIMLHRAFEHAATREDITTAIDNMRRDRLLTPEEATRLAERVAKTLDESIAGEWFDGSWSDVRCEESIIVPNEQHSRRPDRVMSKGERCVIIDYKFGAELPSHREQIAHYAELMRGMGYKHVEGYVWYVNEGKIVKN